MIPVDPFNLSRFFEAQKSVYAEVMDELVRGRKRSHWMWFIFPQLAGLGRSETAQLYSISGLHEARAYLEHPLLGARLQECTGLILTHRSATAEQIFGEIDALKLCSSMTLFSKAASHPTLFVAVLTQCFNGRDDGRTLALLGG